MHATNGVRLALAGGGTGGHVVPGLRLLEHFAEGRRTGTSPGLADLVWFGAGRPVEDRVLSGLSELLGSTPHERVTLHLEPLEGGAPTLTRTALRAMPETHAARKALRAHRSQVLLGLGGYTSLPAVLGAVTLGIPVALLEINSAPGKATRALGRFAKRVFHAWPTTLPEGGEDARHRLVGPPLPVQAADGVLDEAAATARRRDTRLALGFEAERPLLVVLGGSQGALALNRFLAQWATHVVGDGVNVLHQVGPGRLEEGAAPFAGYRPVEYLNDVPAALDAATLVLCRGGASTLAEVASQRRPALVVPYPHHADQHQKRNAEALGDGVRIVEEGELGGTLARELVRLAGDAGESERQAMSRALGEAVPLDAGYRLVAELALLAGTRAV